MNFYTYTLSLFLGASLCVAPFVLLYLIYYAFVYKPVIKCSITFLSIPLISSINGIVFAQVYHLSCGQIAIASMLLFIAYPFLSKKYFEKYSLDIIYHMLIFFIMGCVILLLHTTTHALLKELCYQDAITITGEIVDIQEDTTAVRYRRMHSVVVKIKHLTDKTINCPLIIPYYFILYTRTIEHFQIADILSCSLKKKRTPFIGRKLEKFDFYLMRMKTLFTLFTHEYELHSHVTPPWSMRRSIADVRKGICSRLARKMKPVTYEYFASIFLGYKQTPLLDQDKHLFNIWGISHYLARSGLHITMFVWLWHLFLRCIPVRLVVKHYITLILCLLYYFLSWSSISFIRSLSTFLLYQIGLLLRLPVHFFHLLALVCIVTLAFNPFHLFFLDFQLSFGLTFALYIFCIRYPLHDKTV